MRVICAPDSFKGTLGAGAVAAAMADGLRVLDAIEGIDACPIADGGEGTLDALCAATPSLITRSRTVPGPLGAPVDARYLVRDTCLNRLGDSSRNCPNTCSNTLGDSSGNCPNTCSNT
ncbi:MAG: glycerate kinase, partial [Phycisphaerales bacterium]|nr:glycerate kinase [Phycisphaerales bacterium]